MGRKKGSTAARTEEMRQWVISQLDRGPMVPNSVLLDGLVGGYGISEPRAYALISEAKEARRVRQVHSSTWHQTQETYLVSLKENREELVQLAYVAKESGNQRQQLQALRQIREIDRELLNWSPERTFNDQAEHRAALKAAKDAHLQDPPSWE